jgi:hypothetical protein
MSFMITFRLRQHEIGPITTIVVVIGARHVKHTGTTEGRETVGGYRDTELCGSPQHSSLFSTADVKRQLRVVRRLCDSRWNRWGLGSDRL